MLEKDFCGLHFWQESGIVVIFWEPWFGTTLDMSSHFVSPDISISHDATGSLQIANLPMGRRNMAIGCNRIRVSCGEQTQDIGGKGMWQDVNREIEMLRAMDHPNIAPRLHWMLR